MKLCKHCEFFIRVGVWREEICLHNAPEKAIARDPIDGDVRYNTRMLEYARSSRTFGPCGEDAKFFRDKRWFR